MNHAWIWKIFGEWMRPPMKWCTSCKLIFDTWFFFSSTPLYIWKILGEKQFLNLVVRGTHLKAVSWQNWTIKPDFSAPKNIYPADEMKVRSNGMQTSCFTDIFLRSFFSNLWMKVYARSYTVVNIKIKQHFCINQMGSRLIIKPFLLLLSSRGKKRLKKY